MKLLTAYILLISFYSNAQTLESVNKLADNHQKCLDAGVNMQGCSKLFYHEMDSLLNLAYFNLKNRLTESEKPSLKKEQRLWLKKRDRYFEDQEKTFQKNFKSGEWGSDMFVTVYYNDAQFVRKRVVELIKRR